MNQPSQTPPMTGAQKLQLAKTIALTTAINAVIVKYKHEVIKLAQRELEKQGEKFSDEEVIDAIASVGKSRK